MDPAGPARLECLGTPGAQAVADAVRVRAAWHAMPIGRPTRIRDRSQRIPLDSYGWRTSAHLARRLPPMVSDCARPCMRCPSDDWRASRDLSQEILPDLRGCRASARLACRPPPMLSECARPRGTSRPRRGNRRSSYASPRRFSHRHGHAAQRHPDAHRLIAPVRCFCGRLRLDHLPGDGDSLHRHPGHGVAPSGMHE